MAPNKTTRGGISLRLRVTAWLAAILLVTMLSNGIATVVGQWAVRAFDALLADNAACYTVQDAIKNETRAFERYVRQPTSESEQAYTAACAAAEQSLAALPFDYTRIGAERYARTWNLLQGYEGYRQERDAFLRLSPAADTYIERMYHIKEALVLSCLSAGEGWVLLCFCQFLSSEGCKNCTWIQQR